MINKNLSRDQWYELDNQMSWTPAEPGDEDESGQHLTYCQNLDFPLIRNGKL